MRLKRTKAAVAGIGLALSLAACGEAGAARAATSRPGGLRRQFDDGTRWPSGRGRRDHHRGEVRPARARLQGRRSDIPTGFDVEIAKLLVARSRHRPGGTDAVTWEETISDNREPYLEEGRVDLVLATYSITDERRQIVGQTGPYLVTGQQILVKEDSDIKGKEDLQGEEVCSAEGSTSIENVELEGMVPASRPTTPSASRMCSTAPLRRCPPTARSCSATPPRTRAS